MVSVLPQKGNTGNYNFENYLLITNLYSQSSEDRYLRPPSLFFEINVGKQTPSSEPTTKKARVGDEILYFKPEDEIYMEV